MSSLRRIRVALNLNKYNIPLLMVLAQLIYTAMSGNTAMFPNATTLLGTLASQLAALGAAQQQVKQRVLGAAGARDAKRNLLVLTLEDLRAMVQSLCDASPDQAIALIQAAGMKAVASSVRVKALLAATNGAHPGIVTLVANAALLSSSRKSKSYNWQVTVDGGKTWTAAPSTPYARTTIEGLPYLTTCGFRVSVSVGNAGAGAWSQVVSIPVH
jgi:hypothetical protein